MHCCLKGLLKEIKSKILSSCHSVVCTQNRVLKERVDHIVQCNSLSCPPWTTWPQGLKIYLEILLPTLIIFTPRGQAVQVGLSPPPLPPTPPPPTKNRKNCFRIFCSVFFSTKLQTSNILLKKCLIYFLVA